MNALQPASDPASPAPVAHGECRKVNRVLARVGGKWSVLIVMLLIDRTRRFNDLKREVGGISQRMLTLTLKGLERDGLVWRTAYPTIPPRVEYGLTPLGRSLAEPVRALGDWAKSHTDEIDEAQARYDTRDERRSLQTGAPSGAPKPAVT